MYNSQRSVGFAEGWENRKNVEQSGMVVLSHSSNTISLRITSNRPYSSNKGGVRMQAHKDINQTNKKFSANSVCLVIGLDLISKDRFHRSFNCSHKCR